jgi:hypothetical protein
MTNATRALRRKHSLLTVAVFGPLVVAFVSVTNFYPVPVWNLFSEARDPAEPRPHYTFSGLTAAGEWRDLPPVRVTTGLYGRVHMLIAYTDRNHAFRIESPHPENVRHADRAGGADRLPRGARMPDLIRAWGRLYNRRLPPDSPERLVRVRLVAGGIPGQPDFVWEAEP